MSTDIYTIYNNESVVINFIRFFMHYILSIFLIFCFFVFFFAILILFNFSFVSTIVFFVQSFIPPIYIYIYIYIYLFIYLQFSFDFLNLYFNFFSLYIFLNSTISLCSTIHLLPPFLFHLNFHINLFLLHFHVSPLFLLNYPRQKGQCSLSFSNFVFDLVEFFILFFKLFQPLLFSTNCSFCYC